MVAASPVCLVAALTAELLCHYPVRLTRSHEFRAYHTSDARQFPYHQSSRSSMFDIRAVYVTGHTGPREYFLTAWYIFLRAASF